MFICHDMIDKHWANALEIGTGFPSSTCGMSPRLLLLLPVLHNTCQKWPNWLSLTPQLQKVWGRVPCSVHRSISRIDESFRVCALELLKSLTENARKSGTHSRKRSYAFSWEAFLRHPVQVYKYSTLHPKTKLCTHFIIYELFRLSPFSELVAVTINE